MKGMYKCTICGREFELKKENRYTASHITGLLTKIEYDAFDCPYCGCQHLVNVREHQDIDDKIERLSDE